MKGLLAGLCGFALSLALFLSGAAVATFILSAKPAREPRLDMNQSEVWSEDPRAVNTAAQQFERLPARTAPTGPTSRVTGTTADEAKQELRPEPPATTTRNGAVEELPSEPLDATITGTIPPVPSEEQPASSTYSTAHFEWCARRYRSYRPHDNSYTPSSGGQRTCVSPYMDEATSLPEGERELSPEEVTTITHGAEEEFLSAPETTTGNGAEEELPSEPLDTSVTGSIQPMPSEEQPTSSAYPAAHVEWCASRYRSYRPQDNSYMSFSGGQRTCISPYMDATRDPSDDASPPPPDSHVEEIDYPSMEIELPADANEGINLTQEHISYCFSRYRTYRPEDNSYQPYSGGPRKQCR